MIVYDKIKEEIFIKTLATVIFEKSIVGKEFKIETVKKYYPLFIYYVCGKSENEIQCLYALEDSYYKLENPISKVSLKNVSTFSVLYL